MVKDLVTEDEIRKFIQNEEKLWDMAALTAAPTLFVYHAENGFEGLKGKDTPGELVARESYNLADALIKERKKRLTQASH